MLKRFLKSGSLRLWSNSVSKLRERHPLLNLFWECTLRCNFCCLHCGSNAGEKQYLDELDTDEIKNTLIGIAENFDPTLINISVTGGEPLLRKDLFEVMSLASRLGFNWGMVSNGFLVTEDTIQKMRESEMKTITISIDGIGVVHDEFRSQVGSYDRAMRAVKMLAESDFVKELNITTTIHKKNVQFLEQMYETFIDTGINSWRITNIDPIGRAEGNKELLLDESGLKLLLNFIRNKRKRSEIDIMYECGGFLGERFEGEVRNSFFICSAGITIGSILANGDIFVCPNVPRRKELIQGNVRKDRFSEVWNNKFEFFRKKDRTKCKECLECDHWDSCLGNAMHLWDFEKKRPKMCHLKMIDG
jgi:radical SAM protein with 4Fe4S-binding SPASM domain